MQRLLIFLSIMAIAASGALALDNIVEIKAVRTGGVAATVDTLYANSTHCLQVYVENADYIWQMSMGYRIYSGDGCGWTWDLQPDGLPANGLQAVSLVPGCRLGYPDGSTLDMTGFLVTETDMDGISPDTVHTGGVAQVLGTPAGPLEPMVNLYFTPLLPDGQETGVICIDSTFVPTSGQFCYVSQWCIPPDEMNSPFCFPVKRFVLGDFDMDGEITVSDAVEIIQFVFHGSPNIGPVEAGDVNCDGNTDAADAVYLINYIFKFGPPPECE